MGKELYGITSDGEVDSWFEDDSDWMGNFLDDDVDEYKREFIISFIEDVFNTMLTDLKYEVLHFITFEKLLDQTYIYGLDVLNEHLKFALEEALNYLIISGILHCEEVEIIDEQYQKISFKAYKIKSDKPIN